MASIPIHGVIGAVLRLAARHPIAFLQANALLRLRPLVSTSTLVRDLFFSTETAESVVADCQARLQDESYLVFLDLVFHRVRVRLQRIDAPVLVLGAEHDGFFTARELGRTARAYGTEARMFQGMGHDMMLDQGWEEVADLIDTWARDSTVEPLGPEKSEGREQATTDS
jgi:pimeloyl-ACP methyl ester carboxylesterase